MNPSSDPPTSNQQNPSPKLNIGLIVAIVAALIAWNAWDSYRSATHHRGPYPYTATSPVLASDKDILDAMTRAASRHKGPQLRDCLAEKLDVPKTDDADFDHPQSAILRKDDIATCLRASELAP